MDNPQQDSGVGQSTSDVNEPVIPVPSTPLRFDSGQALGASPSMENSPPPVSSHPNPITTPFLGDRSAPPPPFTIGKPPEIVEPAIPPKPIPEEKLVPNRIVLIIVAILVVVLLVALWWFFRPKASPPEQGEVAEPPLIEGPSPTPVIPAGAELPAEGLPPTLSVAVSPTKSQERATPTPSQVRRASPTPIPTVAEKKLPEVGSVSQTFFMIISGVGAILAGLLFLL